MRIQKTSVFLDKERHLYFDLNAFHDLDKHFGSVIDALRAFRVDPLSLPVFLKIGLAHEEELPMDHIDLLINFDNQELLTRKIMQAVSAALPDSKEEQTAHVESETDTAWDWDWLEYMGTVLLNMPEDGFWHSTPRRLFALWAKHKQYHGLDKEQSQDNAASQALLDQYI